MVILENDASNIFKINADGSDKTFLTDDPPGTINNLAAWSRDGSKIVYTHQVPNELPHIWIMNADGSGKTQLTFGTLSGTLAVFSPDEKQILFEGPGDGVGELWVMNADGSDAHPITHTTGTQTSRTGVTLKWSVNGSYSPDGSKIVYASSQSGRTEIWVMNSDGTGQTQLTFPDDPNFPDANDPSWSPDGQKIVFWSGFVREYGNVFTINPDGTGRTQLTFDPAPMNSDNPVWSPDGQAIMFESTRSGLATWIMNTDGSSQQLLLDGPYGGGRMPLAGGSTESNGPAFVPSVLLFGFVFTYADGGASYSGTFADTLPLLAGSKTVTDSNGKLLGTYSFFRDGVTTRAAGTVRIDRISIGERLFIPRDSDAGRFDGSHGLGSEADSIIVDGLSLSFSSQLEPKLPTAVQVAPAMPAPSTDDPLIQQLDQIYAEVLGRNPDSGGLATYRAQLASGASPDTIRRTVAASPEAQNDLNGLYRQVLGRAIDPSGQATYTASLAGGSSLAAVEGILAASPEAAADLERIYQEVLGREADAGGLATYHSSLAAGVSLDDIRNTIAHSPEARSTLNKLVDSLLDRAPAIPELIGMEDRLGNGATQSTLTAALTATGTAGGFAIITAGSAVGALSAVPNTPALFSFTDVGFGNDTIVGFDPMRDAIELPKAVVADFTAIKSETIIVAGGTLITLNATQSITISGIVPDVLGSGNFLLV